MTNIRSSSKTLALAVGLLSMASLASATPQVQYTYTGETDGGLVMGIHTADYNGGAYVGEFVMTTANPNFSPTLLTYCTDVGAFLSTTFNYTPTPLTSATGVSPAWISGGIDNVAKLWYNKKDSSTTAIQTAGLQVAIWELLYNNLTGTVTASAFYDHNNNGFYLTTDDANSLAAANYAATLINCLPNLGPEQNVEWLAPTDQNGQIEGSQGLLYETPNPTTIPPSVPDATSTLALLGIAAGTLAAASRKLAANKV